VLNEAGGWLKVLQRFEIDHVFDMERNDKRIIILLIDFDKNEDRINVAKTYIPDHLKERVFVIGVWSNPEELKRSFGSLEGIGGAMAKDCRDGTDTAWRHELLAHNAEELARLCAVIPELEIF
jgi:hypothetical protein